LYRDFERGVGEAKEMIELPPHSVRDWDVEALLGGFVDASWAYRFGPPAQDLIVASLEANRSRDAGKESGIVLSQSVRFPAGRPLTRESGAQLGLVAAARMQPDGAVRVSVGTRRFAYGVRVDAPAFIADDDAFSIEPGSERSLLLRPRTPEAVFAGGSLTALNLAGRLALEIEGSQSPLPQGETRSLSAGVPAEGA
jgi:beta-mannosidase